MGYCQVNRSDGALRLARYFVRAYHAEASSVGAFLQLRADLLTIMHPSLYRIVALRKAVEEVHHARMMAKPLEMKAVSCPRLWGTDLAFLFELTLDNAVEGCIFEAFSALKPNVKHAMPDVRLRTAMKVIARDETECTVGMGYSSSSDGATHRN